MMLTLVSLLLVVVVVVAVGGVYTTATNQLTRRKTGYDGDEARREGGTSESRTRAWASKGRRAYTKPLTDAEPPDIPVNLPSLVSGSAGASRRC
jgi:hypothetical protein